MKRKMKIKFAIFEERSQIHCQCSENVSITGNLNTDEKGETPIYAIFFQFYINFGPFCDLF
jgi:hypothetical protein